MELEEQLRLKDSLARLGELTAGIAHEFRNGLATIHGYGRLLDLERLPADFRPYVEGIRAETEALGQVVTNFLNFAKPTELVLAPVDMRAIAERAADEIRGRRARARRRGRSSTASSRRSKATRCCCGRRSATCAATRSRRARMRTWCQRVTVAGMIDRAQGTLRVTVTDNGPGVIRPWRRRCSGRSSRPRPGDRASAWRWSRRSSSPTTAACRPSNVDGGGARLTVTLPVSAR